MELTIWNNWRLMGYIIPYHIGAHGYRTFGPLRGEWLDDPMDPVHVRAGAQEDSAHGASTTAKKVIEVVDWLADSQSAWGWKVAKAVVGVVGVVGGNARDLSCCG